LSFFAMPLLIDGYNVLHTAGILEGGTGPGSLERARLALLNFLAESLTPREIAHTTVVFDAKDAPWGLPSKMEHRGLTVLFAAKYPDADCLLEELISRHSAPRRLTVVSSDHRIQRAARRRKAKALDSDVWYKELVQKRLSRRKSAAPAPERPPVPLLAEDVEYWVRQFGGQSELERWMKQELADGEPSPRPRSEDIMKDEQSLDLANPFPPGYGEDIEE
jgi:predicted RNA-binding protein with PIN domain